MVLSVYVDLVRECWGRDSLFQGKSDELSGAILWQSGFELCIAILHFDEK
jgi:hypothetical protein